MPPPFQKTFFHFNLQKFTRLDLISFAINKSTATHSHLKGNFDPNNALPIESVLWPIDDNPTTTTTKKGKEKNEKLFQSLSTTIKKQLVASKTIQSPGPYAIWSRSVGQLLNIFFFIVFNDFNTQIKMKKERKHNVNCKN